MKEKHTVLRDLKSTLLSFFNINSKLNDINYTNK